MRYSVISRRTRAPPHTIVFNSGGGNILPVVVPATVTLKRKPKPVKEPPPVPLLVLVERPSKKTRDVK
jgi:hypothetical protein